MKKKYVVDIVGDQLSVTNYYMDYRDSQIVLETLKSKEGDWDLDYEYDLRDVLGFELISLPFTSKTYPVIQFPPKGSPDVFMRFCEKEMDTAMSHLVLFDRCPTQEKPKHYVYPEQKNQLTVVERRIADENFSSYILRKEFILDEDNMPKLGDIRLVTEIHNYGEDEYLVVKDFFIRNEGYFDEGDKIEDQNWGVVAQSKEISNKYYITSEEISNTWTKLTKK